VIRTSTKAVVLHERPAEQECSRRARMAALGQRAVVARRDSNRPPLPRSGSGKPKSTIHRRHLSSNIPRA
jgi:hypothetical protein